MHHPNNLCGDVLRSLFLCRAKEETCRYFEPLLTKPPCLPEYCVKLVHIRYSPGGSPKFFLYFDLYPYLESHVTIAVCRMVICIDGWGGEARVVEYRRLRSFPLPREYWDYVKQPF